MRKAGLFAVVAAVAAMATDTQAATASVVVGQSIKGVRLGETLAQLRAQFPKVQIETVRGETVFFLPGLRGGFGHGHTLTGFYTADSGEETRLGIHTGRSVGNHQLHGSSVAAVRKAYPKAKCTHPGAPEPGSVICTLRSRYLGQAVTTSFVFYQPRQGVAEIALELAPKGRR